MSGVDAAAPQRWATLVLVYPVLDARLGSGLGKRRVQRVMGRAERVAVEAVVERLPATILEWSEGLATLDPLDIVEVRRPLKSLSSVGGGRWWVGPREVRPELDDVAATGARFDSVVALWPGDASIVQCGWGCTVGPSEATHGAGFSSISTEHWPTLATDPDPAQGYVHEWLHQVEAVYRELGLSEAELPSLHDAGAFTSWRGSDVAPFGRSFAEHHDGVPGRERGTDVVAVVPRLDDRPPAGARRPLGSDRGRHATRARSASRPSDGRCGAIHERTSADLRRGAGRAAGRPGPARRRLPVGARAAGCRAGCL